jgi:hypothetical protein
VNTRAGHLQRIGAFLLTLDQFRAVGVVRAAQKDLVDETVDPYSDRQKRAGADHNRSPADSSVIPCGTLTR